MYVFIYNLYILIKSELAKVFKICFIFSFSCGKENKMDKLKAPKLAYGQLWGIQIQKEVKSNPKQPSCKKTVKAMVKKDVKSKVAAKKWL